MSSTGTAGPCADARGAFEPTVMREVTAVLDLSADNGH
jgi:hypothetical protein